MQIGDRLNTEDAIASYERFKNFVHIEKECCAFFERGFLMARGWRAVVITEELTPGEAQTIASACRRFGYSDATALDIDHFDSATTYSISLTSTVLAMLEETFLTPSYLVVEEKERFMIVSDSDYYWSIAGHPAFIEKCFDKPLEILDKEFIQMARQYTNSTSSIRRWLNKIAEEAQSSSQISAV